MGIFSRIKRLALGSDAEPLRRREPPADDRPRQTTTVAASEADPNEVVLGDPDLAAQIYGRESCTYSARARRLVEEQGLAHAYIDLDQPHNRRLAALLGAETGQTTVPYVFVRGRFVGGFDELAEQLRLGQLDAGPGERVAVLAPPTHDEEPPAARIELRESIDASPGRKRPRWPETHTPASPMQLMELGLAVEEEASGEVVTVELVETVAADQGVPVARVFAGAALIQGLRYEASAAVRFEVCTGQCQSWGALERLEHLVSLRLEADGPLPANFDVQPMECLERCDRAPVMIVRARDGVAALDRAREADISAAVDQLCRRES